MGTPAGALTYPHPKRVQMPGSLSAHDLLDVLNGRKVSRAVIARPPRASSVIRTHDNACGYASDDSSYDHLIIHRLRARAARFDVVSTVDAAASSLPSGAPEERWLCGGRRGPTKHPADCGSRVSKKEATTPPFEGDPAIDGGCQVASYARAV